MSEPQWLKSIPIAPEYHPTLAEFQDPISYIYKIESQALQYGICKIIPPLSTASKTTAITNFNRTLATSKTPLTFTTQHQQIGFPNTDFKKTGHSYSFKEFQKKAKQFDKAQLKSKGLSELDIETLYWQACACGDKHKHLSVEYVGDLSGSAFVPINEKKLREAGEATTVGETAWNMRVVSTANGSVLRFMEEDIPGVTSPVVCLAMLFSCFGWHVEDHELHSLDYLHFGAAKTWYGVPQDAAVAFEEVVRVNGYGGDVNSLVTCATLAKKTTVMSPEVLIGAGVPCCRLVQNAGEFVVTFPRAYHSGFSHGFNCAEAANIATPGWLKVAKEAAVRRASIDFPPLLSHLQLLYALALSLFSRIPSGISAEPRSSRLKEKKRGEGESIVKELFVQNVIQNNALLHVLHEQGSSCVLLPQNTCNIRCSNIKDGSKVMTSPRLSFGMCSSSGEEMGNLKTLVSDDILLDRNAQIRHSNRFRSVKHYSSSVCEGHRTPSEFQQYGNTDSRMSTSEIQDTTTEKDAAFQSGGLLDHRMFSCVTCGILSFACAAVIQPREAAVQYLGFADCSFSNDSIVASGAPDDEYTDAFSAANSFELNSCTGRVGKSGQAEAQKGISSLDLLADAYGNPSDSEDEKVEFDMPVNVKSSWENVENSPQNEAVNLVPKESKCSRLERLASGLADYSMKSTTLVAVPNCSPAYSCATPKCSKLDISVEGIKVPIKQSSGEDVSKNHIFCLEHAVEVEKGFRSIGGVHVLLVCHPDYSRVETEAKALVEELGIDYRWKDISFREANRDEQARIQSALNVKKAVSRNDDWTVKLGINLSYSVSLTQSPLYCNLIPNNSIIYKAFGCKSPTNSPVKPRISRKRHGKHNKIYVAGKWCGKVWMSNQVHPFLDQRVCQKEESLISFQSQATLEPKVRIESEPELSDQSEQTLLPKQKSIQSMTSTVSQKSEKKRNSTLTKGATKKPKCSELASPDKAAEISPVLSSTPQCRKFLRSGQMKRKTSPLCNNRVENIRGKDSNLKQKEEASGGREKRLRKIPSKFLEEVDVKPLSKKQTRKKIMMTALTCEKDERVEEEAEYKCDMDECTTSPLGNSRAKNIQGEDLNVKQKEEASGGRDKRLRKLPFKFLEEVNVKPLNKKQTRKKIMTTALTCKKDERVEEGAEYQCDMDGCTVEFRSKQELVLHKRNICLVKGCGKKFFSHKYLLQHGRVHTDDRPLKCPWKGCKMTFKWSWARTEHIRVHTGVRPYECQEPGCSQTFRFVSDFGRHRRTTGHSVKKNKA